MTAATTTTTAIRHNIPSAPIQQQPRLPSAPISRLNLKRRRSSYPPTTTPSSEFDSFPFKFDTSIPMAHTSSSSEKGWSADPSWESLLNFTPGTPCDDPFENKNIFKFTDSGAGPSSNAMSGNKIAQMGEEIAWKTILGSVVEVEAVGGVTVARLLQEVWKRGGGDAVTNQCLWPSIIISLSIGESPQERISNPTAHAALALQQLYNLTLRNWEPSIFAGLLSQFTNTNTSTASDLSQQDRTGNVPIYGAATPTKHFESGQWTTSTPGFDWSNILNMSTVNSPFDPREDNVGNHRRTSYESNGRGIVELLAEMEEGREASERTANLAARKEEMEVRIITPGQTTYTPGNTDTDKKDKIESYLPTPETDSSNSPASASHRQYQRQSQSGSGSGPSTASSSSFIVPLESDHAHLEPEQAVSPYVTGGSITTSCSTVSRALSTGSRAPHPTSVTIPTNSFVPPPPMCMFFNPSFKDITQGKIGAWKGELEIKGPSGGVFSVLIIGETGTEDIWQSSTWGDKITYPPPSIPQTGTNFTSHMTPVAHLAREGYVPSAMAMVLCNDPDIQGFCTMVQGLHQEGVAFHLPNSKKLPLMFLPAKFDSTDNLQRLGLAYMTKGGGPVPKPTPTPNVVTTKDDGKKKRRRQSAPAPAQGFKGATRVSEQGRKKRISLGLTKVNEDGGEGKE